MAIHDEVTFSLSCDAKPVGLNYTMMIVARMQGKAGDNATDLYLFLSCLRKAGFPDASTRLNASICLIEE